MKRIKTVNLNLAIFIILIIDTFLLLFLGKSYSKYLLIKPFFYLHDLLLFLIALVSLLSFKFNRNRIESIEYFFLIAVAYLIYSLFKLQIDASLNWYFVLRQFMIFGYLAAIYVILKKLTYDEKIRRYLYSFLIFMVFLSLAVQIIYASYLGLFKGINPFFKRVYFSPIILLGLDVAAAYVLVSFGNLKKHILFLLILLVSFTIGHDSSYLSLLLVYFFYYFLIGDSKQKIILILLIVAVSFALLLLIPSFSDINAQWRIIYWKAILHDIIISNYGIFGNGFGIPFLSHETINKLDELMVNANIHGVAFKANDNYLTAPHNSILTLMFHTGFLSILLLFYPLKTLLTSVKKDHKILILSLSFIGLTVVASFNVILELPHSSTFYWMIFFLLIFSIKNQESNHEIIK